MNHKQQGRDQELIRLLGMLNQDGPEYPDHLRAKRRAAVLAGVIALPVATAMVHASWFAHLAKVVTNIVLLDKITHSRADDCEQRVEPVKRRKSLHLPRHT